MIIYVWIYFHIIIWIFWRHLKGIRNNTLIINVTFQIIEVKKKRKKKKAYGIRNQTDEFG